MLSHARSVEGPWQMQASTCTLAILFFAGLASRRGLGNPEERVSRRAMCRPIRIKMISRVGCVTADDLYRRCSLC